jgi:hypothetical protein
MQDPLRAAVARLRSFGLEGTTEQARQYDACKTILLKYIDNIQAHPGDDKYRRLRQGNAVFQERVQRVPGAVGARSPHGCIAHQAVGRAPCLALTLPVVQMR